MRTSPRFSNLFPGLAVLLAACAGPVVVDDSVTEANAVPVQSRHHDDLISAGLGIDGLRSATPPAFADPQAPSAEELRRRALWTNWRGIADLAPGGGYGEVYGSLAPIAGREYHAFSRLPDAKQPHRVMAQVPDDFDAGSRCLIVTASSGSRGIYGAIAVAGAWGLPRGCAVAYTDKGAGTDYLDLQQPAVSTDIDGRRGDAADVERAFTASGEPSDAPRIAFKHAHSQDNPEADWGRHVRQAADFGLRALNDARPGDAPFRFDNTRVIAVGLSNGGGAVLRAAEDDEDWLDGVVAIAPNIWAGEGGRTLYDYTTQAALLMPCALLHPRFDTVAMARPGGAKSPVGLMRCASLGAAGLLAGATTEQQAEDALRQLGEAGWSDAAIEAGALSVAFDLWRAIGAGYASAYSRAPADAMPCGYAYMAVDAHGQPRSPTPEERGAWWSDASGIPPGAGVMLVDQPNALPDASLLGLRCLRALWNGANEQSGALRAGVQATRATLPRANLPIIVVHGADDGLVPESFSGGAYARWAQANGRDLRYWRVANAQHFDAFLALPPLTVRYVPLLPYAYRALDAMWSHLATGEPLPPSVDIAAKPRTADAAGIAALRIEDLGLPTPAARD
jgi:hydroxybutyrate-dimer hydrolase